MSNHSPQAQILYKTLNCVNIWQIIFEGDVFIMHIHFSDLKVFELKWC